MNRDVKQQVQHNLGVLQRKDPHIIEVLESANYVTGYRFDKITATWHRKEVEGTLFIVRRKQAPFYQFLVMNRLNTENMVEEISADFQIQNTDPYMLYSNKNNEVNGIWFYNGAEREKIYNLIQKIVESIQQANIESEQKVPTTTTTTTTTTQTTSNNIQQQQPQPQTQVPSSIPPPVQTQSHQQTQLQPQQQVLSFFSRSFTENDNSNQMQEISQTQPVKTNVPPISTYNLDRSITPPNNDSTSQNGGSYLDGNPLLSPAQLKSLITPLPQPQSLAQSPPPQQQNAKQNITKQQLQQWLIKLVQDDRFIDMVFNDYISR